MRGASAGDGGDFARHYDRFAGRQSAYFVWLNRGKESLIADIKDAGDRALLHRMIDRTDVFIQNLAPGAAARRASTRSSCGGATPV